MKSVRDTKLPPGWSWHNPLTVVNRNGRFVYLTCGLKDEKLIAQHIQEVMQGHQMAEMRQAALA